MLGGAMGLGAGCSSGPAHESESTTTQGDETMVAAGPIPPVPQGAGAMCAVGSAASNAQQNLACAGQCSSKTLTALSGALSIINIVSSSASCDDLAQALTQMQNQLQAILAADPNCTGVFAQQAQIVLNDLNAWIEAHNPGGNAAFESCMQAANALIPPVGGASCILGLLTGGQFCLDPLSNLIYSFNSGPLVEYNALITAIQQSLKICQAQQNQGPSQAYQWGLFDGPVCAGIADTCEGCCRTYAQLTYHFKQCGAQDEGAGYCFGTCPNRPGQATQDGSSGPYMTKAWSDYIGACISTCVVNRK
jgi:hypothetical protein